MQKCKGCESGYGPLKAPSQHFLRGAYNSQQDFLTDLNPKKHFSILVQMVISLITKKRQRVKVPEYMTYLLCTMKHANSKKVKVKLSP
jgi:hypothetical protein